MRLTIIFTSQWYHNHCLYYSFLWNRVLTCFSIQMLSITVINFILNSCYAPDILSNTSPWVALFNFHFNSVQLLLLSYCIDVKTEVQRGRVVVEEGFKPKQSDSRPTLSKWSQNWHANTASELYHGFPSPPLSMWAFLQILLDRTKALHHPLFATSTPFSEECSSSIYPLQGCTNPWLQLVRD